MIPSRFTNPRFIALAALGLVIALGFFLRRHIVLFLVLTLVIAVVVLALVLWRMMVELKTAKAGKEIQGDLDRQVEEEIQKSTFGQDVVVRNVKAEWDQAMAEFRKSPVGRRLGDRALAQLPMYFVIGPEGAGKSALIEQSGLSSVLRDAQGRPKAVRGVGGGRDFSWWFTEQAFLLDMSGRTLKRSQFDDTDDWVGFLRSLQKQRPERPINGVVLAVPVHEIAGGAKEKVDPLANTLRERLRDLGHHLGMEFPVYVVFTHCDRIAGFAETFEGFGEEQADQAWGATVPLSKSREAAVETLFESEYATLVSALGTLRTSRVHALADDAQRLRALAFPAQLESLRGRPPAFRAARLPEGQGPRRGRALPRLLLRVLEGGRRDGGPRASGRPPRARDCPRGSTRRRPRWRAARGSRPTCGAGSCSRTRCSPRRASGRARRPSASAGSCSAASAARTSCSRCCS